MTRVAAEVADGMIMHPFTTEKYIREVTLPAVQSGLANSERDLADFELDFAPMIAAATNEVDLEKACHLVRDRIAFYGSTPGYRGVFELHGWGNLQEELNILHKQHRVDDMIALIDDDILHAFAVVGSPAEVVDEMQKRYGDVINRTAFTVPALNDDDCRALLERLRG
jgi:probable F420-dependent oxidoreductase